MLALPAVNVKLNSETKKNPTNLNNGRFVITKIMITRHQTKQSMQNFQVVRLSFMSDFMGINIRQ